MEIRAKKALLNYSNVPNIASNDEEPGHPKDKSGQARYPATYPPATKKGNYHPYAQVKKVTTLVEAIEMHQRGIEPRSNRWQRFIIPLDH